MTQKETVDKLVRGAPKLSKAELEQINGLFSAYIFRRSKTREVWTSCCRQHRVIGDDAAWEERRVMQEPHREELKSRHGFKLNDMSPLNVCPWCGKAVKVKELRYTGKRKNLWEFHRPVVLRWWRESLWACAYDAIKNYQSKEGLTDAPKVKLLGIYRFKPGNAVGTSRTWYGNVPFTYLEEQNTPLKGGKWNIGSPYGFCTEYGTGYEVVGLEEVEKSPFRYCDAKGFWKRGDLLKYLTACCIYPRQIEMLEKMGMQETVRDLVSCGKKNVAVLKWEETDPQKAFGLNKQELKEFLQMEKRDQSVLALYKRMKKINEPISLKECGTFLLSGGCVSDYYVNHAIKAAEKWNVSPRLLLRYLSGRGYRSFGEAFTAWKDYITAAEALGYPLHRDNVLMPRGLRAAHDEATRRHREQMEQERRNKEAERIKLMDADYAKRKEKLKEKYGFSMDGLVVCIPESFMEIIEEGRILKHCVAGYADRHLKGTTTILFLRKVKTPKKSFLTIEMKGNRIKQIHGYRNEGLHSAGGRFAPDPAVVYKNWLDTWLSWLKSGSKRDKDGQPKLPRKKEVKRA